MRRFDIEDLSSYGPGWARAFREDGDFVEYDEAQAAADSALAEGIAKGREAERAAIVAWLRGSAVKCRAQGGGDREFAGNVLGAHADCVERGEHVEGGG